MSEKQLLQDPTNRIVAVLENEDQANAVRRELLNDGFTNDQIRVLQGHSDAEKIDTSEKWFADTSDEIKRYQQALLDGNLVVSIPVQDTASREKIHALLNRHDARVITHFGEWVTEMMK